MHRMIPRLGASVAAFALAALPAPTSAADMPAVASALPAQMEAALIVPSLTGLDRNLSQLLTAMQISNLSSVEQLLTVMGLRSGLDFARGMAVVLDLPDAPGDATGMVIVVPVTDYPTFAKNFVGDLGAQRPGISRFEYIGREYFIKSLDGRYAIIAETADAVRTYEPAPDVSALASMIGERGVESLASSNACVVMDVARSADAVRTAMKDPSVANALSFVPNPGDARRALDARVDELIRDGRGLTLALTPGQLGLAVAAVANYTPGTPTAEMCAEGTDARLIGALPAGTSILAAGADLSHPAVAQWLSSLAGREWLEGVTRLSVGMYLPNPPFVVKGGISKTLVRFESDDPGVQLGAVESMLLDPETSGFRGEYAKEFKTFDDVPIHGWTYFMTEPGSIHPLLIGTDPAVYGAASAHDGAGYIFTNRDASFVRAGMGTDESPRLLAEDRVLSQVRSLLPSGASIEAYLSPRPVLAEFSTLFGMMLPEFRLAPQVPPAGMNVVIGGGAAIGSAYIPAQTLAHAIELYNGLIAPRKR